MCCRLGSVSYLVAAALQGNVADYDVDALPLYALAVGVLADLQAAKYGRRPALFDIRGKLFGSVTE